MANFFSYVIICLFIKLFGLLLFMQGFFPIHRSLSKSSLDAENKCFPAHTSDKLVDILKSNISIKSHYDRLVLVVVDALRADFVLSDESRMPFVNLMVENKEAVAFVARAQPPTVTMPRIKALMTGQIPAFSDVIFNFKSSALLEDNLLSQFLISGKQLIFFGDDTWVKLFPNHFKRYDGTTSFMVNDYKEVDNNVTRHLPEEMSQSDWDVLILHYLGLDHIGHWVGPDSPLIQEKLLEMDGVVKMIFNQLMKIDDEKKLSSLLVLCGDHGMSSTGNHGGMSAEETRTPLIFLNKHFNNYSLPDFEKNVFQIDLTPTLALLFGVTIPQNNLGMLLSPLFAHLQSEELLHGYLVNALQIAAVMKHNNADWVCDDLGDLVDRHWHWLFNDRNEKSAIEIMKLYEKNIIEMRNRISSDLTQYDVYSMIVGIILMIKAVLLILVTGCYNIPKTTKISGISLILSVLLSTGHLFICASEIDSKLCQRNLIGIFEQCLLLVSLCLSWAYFAQIKIHITAISNLTLPSVLLTFSFFIYLISLGSSSFVEEEHQTWYFLTATFHSLILREFLISHHTSNNSCKNKYNYYKLLSLYVITLILFKLEKNWNQTGDKWIHLPDIGDWLNKLENKPILFCLFIFSLTPVLFTRLFFHNKKIQFFLFTSICAVLLYKADVHEFLNVADFGFKSDWFAWYVYLSLLIIPCISLKQISVEFFHEFLESITSSYFLLIFLLAKNHNAVLLSIMFVHEYCLFKSVDFLNEKWLILGYVFMAQASFFCMGNSNSLSTIDISAGYVGIKSYSPLFIAVLLVCNTYAGPIFWIVNLMRRLFMICKCKSYEQSKESLNCMVFNVIWIFLLISTLPLLIYCIIILINRHHLFIWSVFAPKLLYQGSWSIFISFIITIILFIYQILKRR